MGRFSCDIRCIFWQSKLSKSWTYLPFHLKESNLQSSIVVELVEEGKERERRWKPVQHYRKLPFSFLSFFFKYWWLKREKMCKQSVYKLFSKVPLFIAFVVIITRESFCLCTKNDLRTPFLSGVSGRKVVELRIGSIIPLSMATLRGHCAKIAEQSYFFPQTR